MLQCWYSASNCENFTGIHYYQCESRLMFVPSNCRHSNCWEGLCLHSHRKSRVQGKGSPASKWLLQGQLWQCHLLPWALQHHTAGSKSAQVAAAGPGSSLMYHLAAPQYGLFSRPCASHPQEPEGRQSCISLWSWPEHGVGPIVCTHVADWAASSKRKP